MLNFDEINKNKKSLTVIDRPVQIEQETPIVVEELNFQRSEKMIKNIDNSVRDFEDHTESNTN